MSGRGVLWLAEKIMLGLVITPLTAIFRGYGAVSWDVAKGNASARGDYLTYEAMDRAEQGHVGLLLFLDVLGL